VIETPTRQWADEQWERWWDTLRPLEQERRWEELLAVCDRALAAVAGDEPSAQLARVLSRRGMALMLLERLPEMVACDEDALRVAEALGDRRLFMHAYQMLALAYGISGDRERTRAMFKGMLRYVAGVGEVTHVLEAVAKHCDYGTPEGLRLALMSAEWVLLLDPLNGRMWRTKYRMMINLGRQSEAEAAVCGDAATVVDRLSAAKAASALEWYDDAARLHRALAEAARAEGLEELAHDADVDAQRYPRIAARKARERGERDA